MDKHRDQILVRKATLPVKTMKAYEIGSQSHRPSFCSLLENDPDLIYHKIVNQAREVVLPIIPKILNGKLILKDYTLDSGNLRGLAKVLSAHSKIVTDVLFDNCGIDDQELSLLLQGFTTMYRIVSFTYKNNVFLEQGLAAMKPVLLRADPINLQELRLANCVTAP